MPRQRNEPPRSRLTEYKRARRKFATIVYILTTIWILLGGLQWAIVSAIADAKEAMEDSTMTMVCIILFAVAIILITIFIFWEKVRFIKVLNWILTIVIVECIIIAIFAFAARTLWPDLVVFFAICGLLILIFIVIGSVLPHDLTLDVVILFVLAFIFLIVTVFIIMLNVALEEKYSFEIYQLFITMTVLMFVMYHAQTINGGRFAEMRLKDYLLASLILFHDFVIIFLLTFYAQRQYQFVSPDSMKTTTMDPELATLFEYDENEDKGSTKAAAATPTAAPADPELRMDIEDFTSIAKNIARGVVQTTLIPTTSITTTTTTTTSTDTMTTTTTTTPTTDVIVTPITEFFEW